MPRTAIYECALWSSNFPAAVQKGASCMYISVLTRPFSPAFTLISPKSRDGLIDMANANHAASHLLQLTADLLPVLFRENDLLIAQSHGLCGDFVRILHRTEFSGQTHLADSDGSFSAGYAAH